MVGGFAKVSAKFNAPANFKNRHAIVFGSRHDVARDWDSVGSLRRSVAPFSSEQGESHSAGLAKLAIRKLDQWHVSFGEHAQAFALETGMADPWLPKFQHSSTATSADCQFRVFDEESLVKIQIKRTSADIDFFKLCTVVLVQSPKSCPDAEATWNFVAQNAPNAQHSVIGPGAEFRPAKVRVRGDEFSCPVPSARAFCRRRRKAPGITGGRLDGNARHCRRWVEQSAVRRRYDCGGNLRSGYGNRPRRSSGQLRSAGTDECSLLNRMRWRCW